MSEGGWQPVDGHVRYGTVADLRMASGRIYRAVYEFRGRCAAWWPEDGRRKRPIGLYDPEAFRVAAVGLIDANDWRRASGYAGD